jgi:hypothetical protein
MPNLSSRLYSVLLVPGIVALSFGLNTTKAFAQTTYPFNAVYDVLLELKPIRDEVSKATLNGTSADAPYGLTNIASESYSRLDPVTGITTTGLDAAEFGINGLPILTDVFFGSGDNKLFGTSTATAVADLPNLTASASGTFTITGGSGEFTAATGTLQISDTYTLSLDPTAPIKGLASVSGSFQTFQKVPEPNAGIGMVLGICGIGLFLKRQRKQISSQLQLK